MATKWGKDLVKWCAAELPAVITDLAKQGPEEVFDELMEIIFKLTR